MTTTKKKVKTAKQKEAARKRKEREAKKSEILALDGTAFRPSILQFQMAQLIIDPENRSSLEDKAASIKVPRRTFFNWWAKDDFRMYCVALMERYSDFDEIDVYKSLKLQIKRGNVQAIRTYYELKGKLGKRFELTGPGGKPIQTESTIKYVFNMPEPPDTNDSRPPQEIPIEGEEYTDRPIPKDTGDIVPEEYQDDHEGENDFENSETET